MVFYRFLSDIVCMNDTKTFYEEISGPALVNRVDSLLHQKLLSRKQLADHCGFSVQNIARWKTKGSLPDVKVGVQVADFLEVPLYWLITGTEKLNEIPTADFQLLSSFHVLDESDQEVVLATIQALSKKYIREGFEGHTEVN